MGALIEVIAQWLVSGGRSLRERLPELRTLLLRSIGAKTGGGP